MRALRAVCLLVVSWVLNRNVVEQVRNVRAAKGNRELSTLGERGEGIFFSSVELVYFPPYGLGFWESVTP
jgi:hypothetical protein